MYLLSEESLNSMESDESIYSLRTNELDSSSVKGCKSMITGKPKRKREKLDHLTNEEKILRRKIKNRISAQSARDRKKMKMSDLQDQLAALSEERLLIVKENQLLKKRNQALERENNELRNRLSSSSDDDHATSSTISSNTSPSFDGLFINSAEIIKDCPQHNRTDHQSIHWRINQFIDNVPESTDSKIKESNSQIVENWCEQIVDSSDRESIDTDQNLSNDFIDELVTLSNESTTDGCEENCITGHDQVPAEFDTNYLIEQKIESSNRIDFANEYYFMSCEDHIYSKPPTLLSSVSSIDKPLNSFENFDPYLNESNAFQNSDLDLYVN